MTGSTERMADAIRAAAVESPEAFTACLDGLWAAEVIAEHDPPMASMDGPRPGRRQTEAHLNQDKEFRTVMPDYRLAGASSAVDGDKIAISCTISGTLNGNRPVGLPVKWVFTAEGDKLVHVLTVVDQTLAQPFGDMLRAARITPD